MELPSAVAVVPAVPGLQTLAALGKVEGTEADGRNQADGARSCSGFGRTYPLIFYGLCSKSLPRKSPPTASRCRETALFKSRKPSDDAYRSVGGNYCFSGIDIYISSKLPLESATPCIS